MPQKSYYWFVAALALVGAYVLVSRGWLNPSEASRQRPGVTERSAASSKSALGSRETAGDSDEVARLRAELEKKNEMVRALVTVAANRAGEASDDRDGAPASPTSDPDQEAMNLLDERIHLGVRDPRLAFELDRTLRDVIALVSTDDTQVESLECASSLCRVLFSAKKPGADSKAIEATVGKLPKTFTSSVAYRVADAQMVLYAGRTAADTEVPAEDLP